MSWLQDILKKHLLLSALLFSIVLHLSIIFWVNSEEVMQSSLGNSQLILLEPSNVASPAVSAKEESVKSSPIKKSEQTGKPEPRTTGKTKKVEQDLPIQKNIQINDESKTSEESTKATSNSGELVNQSGKELSTEEKYKNLVLSHFLKKAQSAPIDGAAIIHLTIIKAGIATQVSIEVLKGGVRYKNWLQTQVLSANPFPPLPKHLNATKHTLNLGISHD